MGVGFSSVGSVFAQHVQTNPWIQSPTLRKPDVQTTSIIPALGRQRQKNFQFKIILGSSLGCVISLQERDGSPDVRLEMTVMARGSQKLSLVLDLHIQRGSLKHACISIASLLQVIVSLPTLWCLLLQDNLYFSTYGKLLLFRSLILHLPQPKKNSIISFPFIDSEHRLCYNQVFTKKQF